MATKTSENGSEPARVVTLQSDDILPPRGNGTKKRYRPRGANKLTADRPNDTLEVTLPMNTLKGMVRVNGLWVTPEQASDLAASPDPFIIQYADANQETLEAYDPDLALADQILPTTYSKRVGLGLVFAKGVTYEQWEADMRLLLMAERIVPWLIADALAYGEDVFHEDFAQVFDSDRYADQTLMNWSYVARRIPARRRRAMLPFTVHQAVAALDVEDQEILLDRAQDEGLKREEVRNEVRKLKIERERDRVSRLPAPKSLATDLIHLDVAEVGKCPLSNETVDAIITSPPYGLDGSRKGDKYRVEDVAADWYDLMRAFLEDAMRLLRPQGRLIVNLPIDTTVGGYRPLSAEFTVLARRQGFQYATTIVWRDNQLGKSLARGSVDSPGGIRVVTPAEHILVFSKGDWVKPGKGRPIDLTHDEWVEWTNGDWEFPGETQPWEGFTAAFPMELPRRLLKLFTFQDDVICDPFGGSGTVPLACWRSGRACYAYDIDPVQVASMGRRINAAVLGAEQ
jgi:site-specific DNA-methyltransferase (adenine-specific)